MGGGGVRLHYLEKKKRDQFLENSWKCLLNKAKDMQTVEQQLPLITYNSKSFVLNANISERQLR